MCCRPCRVPVAVVTFPELGNAGPRRFQLLDGLARGRTYYLSVQSVDSAFAGSPFSPEIVFSTHTVTAPAAAPAPTPGD